MPIVEARPQQVDPSGTVAGETGSAQSGQGYTTPVGVASPDMPTKSATSVPKDTLPPAQMTPAEKSSTERINCAVAPREQIQKYLKALKFVHERQSLSRAKLQFVDSVALQQAFPDSLFYVLRFPQWPLPIDPPQPLGNNNIFVIAKDSKLSAPITSIEQLKPYLVKNSKPTVSEANCRTLLEGSMALVQELVQDGMYQFEIDKHTLSIDRTARGRVASGQIKALPNGGNGGAVFVTLQFGLKSELTGLDCQSKLIDGMRPICQSTKLLDADPIVRKMAEKDLLIMGRSAGDYLQWQREQVSPELKVEIDRVWARILKEGR
ncbi:MAG: hypothetical protein IPP57_12235 [Candidatus Obscuribacter sp.]|nr:hypothetical protein [Candidatus Obscuribacter sp.]